MRVYLLLLPAVLLAACETSEKKLKDVSFGKTIQGDYDLIVDRAKHTLLRAFPKGFDPDRTNEDTGEFWTIWHVKTSMWYRGTTRERAHLVVEDLGDDQVRVGVAVVRQINDNIDNPHLVDEARWVRSHRDPEMESRLEASIARRYLQGGPSEQWKAKNSGKKRSTMRQDLIDRYKDVDLESSSRLGYREDDVPGTTTGHDTFYGKRDEEAWKDKYGAEKARKKREEERKRKEEEKRQEEMKKKNKDK